jgi:O-antigen/teichoic acid export membrane protein
LIKKLFSLVKETFTEFYQIARSPKKGFSEFFSNSLYRNAVYLMLNNVVVQATGFFFWMAAARLYSTEAVGLTSAAITAMSLLATLSTLGMDYALIRFLPGAGDKTRDMINTCLTICGAASIALALIFIAGLSIWSPALDPIRHHPLFFSVFVISVAATSLNVFTQRIFVAKRRAGIALTRGLIFGFSRFIPLVIMVYLFQSFGIFTAWGIAILLTVVISFISIPKVEQGYTPSLTIKKEVLGNMVSFSFTNYITNLCLSIPGLVFPIMVVNMIGAEQNAYFYIGWALGSVLFVIPWSLSFSLFAEGSNDQNGLRQQVVKSLKLIMLILIPSILLIILVGDKLLLLFGHAYSENATNLLRILALSALPYSIIFIYFSIRQVKLKMGIVIILSLFTTIVALGLSWVLLPRMGIIGIGIAWLTSQTLTAIIIGWRLLIKQQK